MPTTVDSQTDKTRKYFSFPYDTNNYIQAAEWDATESFSLSQIKIWTSKVGSPSGDTWIEVWDEDAGEPGSLITNGTSNTIDCSTFDTDTAGGEQTYTFSTQPSLTSGSKYFFVLEHDISISTSNFCRWWGSTDDFADNYFGHWVITNIYNENEGSRNKYAVVQKDSAATEIDATAGAITITGYNPVVSVGSGTWEMGAYIHSPLGGVHVNVGVGNVGGITLAGFPPSITGVSAALSVGVKEKAMETVLLLKK